MKKIFSTLIVVLLSIVTYAQGINTDESIIYKYGVYQLNKKHLIHNLRTNVNWYIETQMGNGWTSGMVQEFQNAYMIYMRALDDANNPYRFYTDDFGALYDLHNVLGDEDKDDYWYDNRGNRITGTEYRMLNEKKRSKYFAFYANKEFVLYFKVIADAIVSKNKKEAQQQKQMLF